MKHLAACLVGIAVSGLLAEAAPAVDVCAYTVASALGTGCPVRAGATACVSVTPATGPCDAALECFGRPPFFCRSTLVPKSGPQAQCPAGSRRLTGFSCFAPQHLVRTHTPTPPPTPTVTPGTLPPALLQQQTFRAADGTEYQIVSLAAGSPAQVRITTLAGSTGGVGGCQVNSLATPGQPVAAIAGALSPRALLHPFDAIQRTAAFTPNDAAAVSFTPDSGGRLVIGTGAGAVSVCSTPLDCMGQQNVLPLVRLDSATGGVAAACIADGLAAGSACDGTNQRAAFAFGVPSQGVPPHCTDPAAVTVATTLCAPPPADGFTLHNGEVIVFVHGLLEGLGYLVGVAGFGVSPQPVGVCASGGVTGAVARLESIP